MKTRKNDEPTVLGFRSGDELVPPEMEWDGLSMDSKLELRFGVG